MKLIRELQDEIAGLKLQMEKVQHAYHNFHLFNVMNMRHSEILKTRPYLPFCSDLDFYNAPKRLSR